MGEFSIHMERANEWQVLSAWVYCVWGRGGTTILYNKPRLSCIKKPIDRSWKATKDAVPMDRQSTRPKTGPHETKRGSVGREE